MDEPAPEPSALRARWSRLAARGLLEVLYRPRAHGTGHVPRTGPVIVAANHTGYLDGAVVLGMSPRPSHFLVLDRSFTGVAGLLLRASAQIPIDQRRGDRRALGQALAVLGRGGVVGIFPEGGRARLEQATERVRTTLAEHVRRASERHGIPLPTDVPPDLLE